MEIMGNNGVCLERVLVHWLHSLPQRLKVVGNAETKPAVPGSQPPQEASFWLARNFQLPGRFLPNTLSETPVCINF